MSNYKNHQSFNSDIRPLKKEKDQRVFQIS